MGTEMKPAKQQVVTQMATQSAQLMDNVIQLASTPDFDIGKLERLIELYNKQQETLARQDYYTALSKVQGKMEAVKADMFNDQTKSWYASIEALHEACRKEYSKAGFSLEIDTELEFHETTPYLKVSGTLSHSSGHQQTKTVPIPADGKGAQGGAVQTRTHAGLSALTYGRKAITEMFFNLSVSKQHDDDGNAAGKRGLDPKKLKQLNDAMDKSKNPAAILERIKKGYEVDNIGEIPEDQFNAVLININKIVRKEAQNADN